LSTLSGIGEERQEQLPAEVAKATSCCSAEPTNGVEAQEQPTPEPTPAKRPPLVSWKEADEVLDYGREVCGWGHHTGPQRPKALASLVLARMKAHTIGDDDDAKRKRAVGVCCIVIDEKHTQTTETNGYGKPRFDPNYLRVQTLFAATNFESYLDEARQRRRSR